MESRKSGSCYITCVYASQPRSNPTNFLAAQSDFLNGRYNSLVGITSYFFHHPYSDTYLKHLKLTLALHDRLEKLFTFCVCVCYLKPSVDKYEIQWRSKWQIEKTFSEKKFFFRRLLREGGLKNAIFSNSFSLEIPWLRISTHAFSSEPVLKTENIINFLKTLLFLA